MARAAFFYANGTSYTLNLLEVGFSIDNAFIIRVGNKVLNPTTSKGSAYVPGLNGKTYIWDGGPANDPFPYMLDSNIWDSTRIAYPASALGMGPSITYGIDQTVNLIKKLPSGKPFAIGGYSQGAAVMSGVYNEIRNANGRLYSRRNDFLGGVAFGNPRRQLNYRGDPTVSGTWSGTWDATHPNGYRWYLDPTPNVTGGHGSFSSTGTYARLTNCDTTKWQEFTAPGDIFSSSGDSTIGTNWTSGNDLLLNLLKSQYLGAFLSQLAASAIGINGAMLSAIQSAFALGNGENNFKDSLGRVFTLAGLGHVTYPFLPPPAANGTLPVTTEVIGGKTHFIPNGLTSFQLALTWLEAKAQAWSPSPILLPSTPVTITRAVRGWSPTRKAPSRVPAATTTTFSNVIVGNATTIGITAGRTASVTVSRPAA